MKVIAVANQKGGIGKTSTATALASILNERGKRTLLIDADKQKNSTDTYRAQFEGVPTLYDVLVEDQNPLTLNEVIQHTEMGDIVAADPLLIEAESKLLSKGIGGYTVLRNAIQKLEGYDYVIFDTPPAVDMVLRNVLTASDEVVIPMTASRYGFQGMSDFSKTINDIRQLNPNLKIAGILLVMYNPITKLSKEANDVLAQIASSLDTKYFENKIRRCEEVQKAQSSRSTLIKFKRGCTAERDYEDFVEEYLGL